jgi:arylsulfatase A-like enzyme
VSERSACLARWRSPAARRALASLAVAALSLSSGCRPEAERPVRLVLITLDTLRLDGFDGERAAMPATAAWAERGLVFDNAYAATTTTQPTHASLLTGQHPWRHGVPRNGAVLAESWETLPEQLQAAGFSTAAVVASFPLQQAFGFGQGFDVYDDAFAVSTGARNWEGQTVPGQAFYSLSEDVLARALARLDGLSGERQFLWVHFYDPHEPYGDAGDDVLTLSALQRACISGGIDPDVTLKRARSLYDADLAVLDRDLGRLLSRLEADGEEYDTHVVLTSDHGESFGEGGSLGHGKRLSVEQLRVPLAIVSPRVTPGRRQDPAGSVDVAATLLSLAGLEAGEGEGRDLTLAPRGGRPPSVFGMRRTFAEPYSDIRTDGSRVTVTGPRFYAVIEGTLYTGTGDDVLVEDLPGRVPGPDVVDPLLALFGTFASELSGADLTEVTDPDTQRALEQLGYAR